MEPTEFDSTLGGNEHLPFSANSLKFASARSIEIAAMTESILRPSQTKLVFQTLPVYMRRRVMSHNSKRLPHNLRQAHLEQLKKSGLPPKQKRPSRKYRRRPRNLLEEYSRRQKKNIWLETHLWHAKRFHMTDRWGYRLPYGPCDKAFRACYRGSSTHCLLQDISYHIPVQITGSIETIKELFSYCTDGSCGLGLCAKAYTSGARQGIIHLYGMNTFPYGYIGSVQFIWVTRDSDNKTLWFFVHPSQIKQVENLLITLTNGETKVDDYETAIKKRKLAKEINNVKFKIMPGLFNRFRLTGPNSHAILVESLKCVTKNDIKCVGKWMSLHPPQNIKEKEEYWQSINGLSSPSQLQPNIVISLVVKDPRLMRPLKRTKAKASYYKEINSESLLCIPPYLSNSPLWDLNIHDTIKSDKITNGKFIELITKTQLIPGEINEDNLNLQSVPIVLIQRPGSQNSDYKKIGYGSGWDIIVPSGYGIPFWLTFIMFGARAGGLRETESLAFEMGECYLPPDSNAGKEKENRLKSEQRDKYFRLPPSKRVNYIKLGINSPFICPWNLLLSDWSDENVKDYFVLRDRKVLNKMQEKITSISRLEQIENSSSCLVPVYLKLTKKGSLQKNAIICMPESRDIVDIKNLFEPHHEDPNEKSRKIKRAEHIKIAKQLKRKRMKLKKKSPTIPINLRNKTKSEPSEYVKSMRELWLPSNIETVRKICSRQVMGYIVQGAFSFTEACSCGIGYIAYNALSVLLCNGQNQVLIRNTSSRKYQLANIVIISR